MISEVDINKDGFVDKKEFQLLVASFQNNLSKVASYPLLQRYFVVFLFLSSKIGLCCNEVVLGFLLKGRALKTIPCKIALSQLVSY